jgi:hypothetical protein
LAGLQTGREVWVERDSSTPPGSLELTADS